MKNLKYAAFVGLLSLFLFSVVRTTLAAPGPMEPYLNGVFPAVTPGFGGSWYLENTLSDLEIAAPLEILEFPSESEDHVLVLCKTGIVWLANFETQEQTKVLDISDQVINYSEAGAISLVLHPEFGNPAAPEKQTLFLFYRYKPNPQVEDHKGYNRLSKFDWDADAGVFMEDSEEILIQQYDRSAWHNGGGLFFDDGFLFLALGDEGGDANNYVSNQSLSRGLFSGVLRIDVDNDPLRSHPIRRQPIANAEPPEGWTEGTFTQGYSIPNDNPWLSESGEVLEEFYAIGIRSPYSTHFDRHDQVIWLSDVGSSRREEVNQVEKGDNLQWNFLEGDEWAGHRPEVVIGNEKPPLFHYGEEIGSCIIGGSVYRGSTFPYLNGRYLFGDYISDKLVALDHSGEEVTAEILFTDFGSEPLDLPEFTSFSGVHYRPNGDILITTIAWPFVQGGRILHLRQRDQVPDPPARLSELGVFTNMDNLETAEGIFPYGVNAPLWSDRAAKRRWMAIPNNGDFNLPSEQIGFRVEDDWTFPEGTVFIKHFALPTDLSDPTQLTKLETRFFVMTANGSGYGLTYKWNEEQTEAYLQRDASSETYEVFNDGELIETQRWDFPGRDQCMSCHNANAKLILGVKTHQLNGNVYYPDLGREENQLKYLSDNGIIAHDFTRAGDYPRAYAIDNEDASLDERIRSYVDANCAGCHQVGGVPGLTMDLRFNTPLIAKNILDLPTLSQTSSHDNLIVESGNHAASELWIRDQSNDADKMPPIGRNLVDETYIVALAEWIDGLGDDGSNPAVETILTFPNPTDGWLIVRANPEMELPLRVDAYDMGGRLVHTVTGFDEHVIHLDLQRVGSGTYAIRVTDAAGTHYSDKILVR